MAQNLTNMDAALKENYGPGLRNALNNSNPILTEVPIDDTSIVGRRAVWAIHTTRSASTSMRGEGVALPSAGNQGYTEAIDSLTFGYHTVKVTGPAQHLTRGDEGAFVRALESELAGAEQDIKNDYARQLFGQAKTDGTNLQTGVLAVLSADPGTGSVFTVATASAAEMRYFFKNQTLRVINPSGGAARTGTYTVVSVDKTAKTITVAEAIDSSVASADYLVRGDATANNFGKEIKGLRHLVNGTQAYATIDPASVPNWAAVEAGSSTTPVSEVLFNEASEDVLTDGDGSMPTLYVVEYAQRRKLASQLQAQKRYDGAQTTLKSGWKGLDIAEGTLVADRFCPSIDGFGLSTDKLKRFVALDWSWDDDSGSVLYKALDDSDAVQARFRVYHQFAAVNRNSHVHITMSTPSF